MAADKKVREGGLSGMTTKQKVMALAVVVLFLFIGWQVIGMMGGGSSTPVMTPPPTKKQSNNMSANMPSGSPAQSNMPSNAQANAIAQAQSQQASDLQQLREIPVPVQSQILETQKQSEQKYIDDLNQLQMLKIQREIAEANQAIAAAKLATVTSEKNVSDILTKPVNVTPPPVQVPEGAYANSLVNPAAQGISTIPPEQPQPRPAEPVSPEVQYVVLSVSMQLGRWNAVIGTGGKLYNVSIGDVLSPDGSVVVSINKGGVVLMKHGKRKKVSLVTSI